MLGVNVERRKYVDEWGDTNDSQISFLGYWIDGGTIYKNRKFAKITHLVSRKSPLEPNLGRQPGYNFFFCCWYSTSSLEEAAEEMPDLLSSKDWASLQGVPDIYLSCRYSQQRAIRLLLIWVSSIQCSPSSPPSLQSYKARNIDTTISIKYTVKPQFFLKLCIFNWRIIAILCWFLPYINMYQA